MLLQRAADQAALFLVRGLRQYCAAQGAFSTSSLKAIAEHLGVFREVAKRHPDARRSLLPHVDDLRRFVTSPLFYYFCLRNPKHFRLWGSLLCDVAFFFDDLSEPHSRFVRRFPLEELIEGEAADFRRLDAADICVRSSARNNAARRAFSEAAAGNSLLARSYSIERFDTGFVYYLTHFAFYVSRWGATAKPFTSRFYRNLERATQWSRAVGDADLVSECIVASLYSRQGTDCGRLVDFVIGRQLPNGGIVREPSAQGEDTPEYERLRHTTLVGLWALSQYAAERGVRLSLGLQDLDRAGDLLVLSGSEREELRTLEGLISTYAGVAPADVSTQEQRSALQLTQRIAGLRPFRCGDHYLRDLEDSLPRPPAELSLPRALTRALLEAVGDRACGACLRRLLDALQAVAAASSAARPSAGGDRLHELIAGFLRLPLVNQQAGRAALVQDGPGGQAAGLP